MRKNAVYRLIAFAGLAMLGLVALQCYWLAQSWRLSEQQFAANVRQSLLQVATRIETAEILHNMGGDSTRIILSQSFDEQEDSDAHNQGHKIVVRRELGGDSAVQQMIVRTDDIQETALGGNDAAPPTQKRVMVRIENTDIRTTNTDTKNSPRPNGQKQRIEALVSRIAQERATSNIPLKERLKNLPVDSLIRATLQNRGIYEPFHFHIELSQPPATVYSVQLFPEGIFTQTGWLVLAFDQTPSLRLHDVGLMALLALLCSAIVMGCFVQMIRMFFEQKRLVVLKNDFINNLTHEFKTPLATISLAADALRNAAAHTVPAVVERYTQIIKDENARLHRHIDTMLTLARIDRHEIAMTLASVDMHTVLKEVAEAFRLPVEARGGHIQLSLNATHAVVQGDAEYLGTAIRNLIDNALKYSPDAPQILLSTADGAGKNLVISVQDNGIGIAPADSAHIFERFYRVQTGNLHDVKGFGLGLTYVREIALAHGGDIAVTSDLGHGSTFTLTLPQ